MTNEVWWGVFFTAYIVVYSVREIGKQLRRGDNFSFDRETVLLSAGFGALIVCWKLGVPRGFGLLITLFAVGVVAFYVATAALRHRSQHQAELPPVS